MKTKFICLIGAILLFGFPYQLQAQKSSTFIEVANLFPEAEIPLKRKNDIMFKINKISKSDAMKYLHLSEGDLKMNNPLIDMDESKTIDRWQEILPGALSRITREKYVALVCAMLKSPDVGLETYRVWLTTFTYQGNIIDSITIRSQYTPESDWRDFVLLKNDTLRIFDYMPNLENYDKEKLLKRGVYSAIDENGYMTIVEINDYQIDENGKIKHIKTLPKKYLKKTTSFYRDYQKDSDDPMNEYDF
jgi:hypothetical protein